PMPTRAPLPHPNPVPCPDSHLLPRVPLDEGEDREVPGPLDRGTELSLVTRARARHPTRQDLALVRDEARQRLLILVVDQPDPGLTELAVLCMPPHRYSSSSSS